MLTEVGCTQVPPSHGSEDDPSAAPECVRVLVYTNCSRNLRRKYVERWSRGGDVQQAPKEAHLAAIRLFQPEKRFERQTRHCERGEHEHRGSRVQRQSLHEYCAI